MDADFAVELGRNAIKACMMIGGPILLIGLIVGLVVGLLQAMTQVQDQTVSVVPKLLLMMAAIAIALPWLAEQLTDFTKSSFQNPIRHQVQQSNGTKDYPIQSGTVSVTEATPKADDEHQWN